MTVLACPKPAPREKAPRTRIKPESEKHRSLRLAGLLPKKKREITTRRQVQILRAAIKKKRPKHEVRQMGTPSRRKFVASLPCCACQVEGYSANAHTSRHSGMARKGPATEIAPLCNPRPLNTGSMYRGCHSELDMRDGGRGRDWLESTYKIDLTQCAAATEAAWQAAKAAGRLPL